MTSAKVAEIFDSLEYGPSPESDKLSLLTDIGRQIEHYLTGRYSANNRHPVG